MSCSVNFIRDLGYTPCGVNWWFCSRDCRCSVRLCLLTVSHFSKIMVLKPVCLGKHNSILFPNVEGLGLKPIPSCFEFCSAPLMSYRLCCFFYHNLVHSWELLFLLGKLSDTWESPGKIPAFRLQLCIYQRNNTELLLSQKCWRMYLPVTRIPAESLALLSAGVSDSFSLGAT